MNEWIDEKNHCALIRAEDFEVENLEKACVRMQNERPEFPLFVAYGEKPSGCRFQVTSRTDEVRADELAQYLCEGVGAGGGKRNSAGGFLSGCLLLVERGEADYEGYFKERLTEYFAKFQVVRSAEYKARLDEMHSYRKKQTRLGVVHTMDFLREGTPLLVRTLEGDMECVSAPDLFIMIGIDGEVYPIRQEKFERSYELTDGKPEYVCAGEPAIYNHITGESYILAPFVKTCKAKESRIYAKELKEATKVFTQWDPYKYLRGEKGDFIAVREDDLSDVYTIERSIFFRTYERCE